MRHLKLWTEVLSVVCVVACQAPPEAPVNPPPPEETQTPPAACALQATPVQLKAGVRAHVPLTLVPSDATVEVVDAPNGWATEWSAARQALLVRPSFAADGVSSLVLSIHCQGTAKAVSVELEVRPLRWEPVAAWTPGVDGPIGREHPLWWTTPDAPDHAWMYGGLVQAPRPYAVGTDLWRLDLRTERWEQVASVNGAPPPRAGGRTVALSNHEAAIWGGLPEGAGATAPVLSFFKPGASPPEWTHVDVANSAGMPLLGALVWDQR